MEHDFAVLDNIRLNFNESNMMIINIALAFIMFGVALDMSIGGFRALLKNPRPIFAGFIAQFILLPLVTFLLIIILKPTPSIALGMILVAACPGGNVSNFITSLSKGNVELSVLLTAIATLLAVLLTPLNFTFWGGLYASSSNLSMPISINLWQMAKTVMLLLGLPIVLGMLARHYYPHIADKVKKAMKYLSIIFFFALVVAAIMQNFIYFKQYLWLIAGIVLLHNFVAFLSGYFIATIMKVKHRDRRTITIETGIQNSGLALVLIMNPNLFDGLGGMALIAAFWGVWHIISGMMIGAYWSVIKD